MLNIKFYTKLKSKYDKLNKSNRQSKHQKNRSYRLSISINELRSDEID